MQVKVLPQDEFAVIHLQGEFDAMSFSLFRDEVDRLLAEAIDHIAVNLQLVTFINSGALGVIIKAKRDLARKGGNLVVSNPSTFCREIIERISFDRVVTVFASDEEAVVGLRLLDG